MATTTAGKLGSGRGPKYRTSCDGCQAMKIKCGQEKPSCRRCSTQRLECVYSLSRRMGRPREKRNTQDGTSSRQIHLRDTPPGDGSLGNALSSPAPVAPLASFDATTTTTTPSRPNDVTVNVNHHVTIASPFPDPADDWPISPPETEQHASKMGTYDSYPADSQPPPPQTSSLEDCLQMCSPLGINGATEFADLYDFLEDTMPPLYDDASQSTAPRPTSNAFDLQNLPPFTSLSSFIDDPPLQSNLGAAQMTHTGDPCACAAGPPSKDPSQGDAAGLSDNLANTVSDAASNPDQSPALCIAPEKDLWSTSGRSISEQNYPGTIRPFAATQCTCTTSVLQSIEAVKDTKRKRGLVSLDSVLTLEAGSKSCISQLLTCRSCRADTSTHLLGLMCIRMVLDLLHKAVREEFVPRKRASLALSSSSSAAAAAANTLNHNRSDLYIGIFKVPPLVRSHFLHRALQARFRKLAAMLTDWEHLVRGDDPAARAAAGYDCFSQAAAVVLRDVESVLRMVVGWVDMGSAKV
ncbi:unnamed protein product [Periconia digitata]|uniref:Zn(2)-C6 fungal-type domain-containing protein n=1 Tax=Periconia digitata TaxID=1303443 RepID=A0A9W4UI74_9PLEO|nr:unnamed protein product [Periconia digitata]